MPKSITLDYTLEDVKAVINKWLYIEDDRIIDVIMGAYISTEFKSDPSWLIIIGPSSSAKTEILSAFDEHDKACFISTITPKTLVSGLKKEDSVGQKEPSLLPRIAGKVIIIKDLTSMLTMRPEHRAEIFSQLREIYDGKYDKHFGTGGEIKWRGHVGLIAACTPVYDKHQKAINTLGDRFLLYRLKADDPEKTGRKAIENSGKQEQIRNEIKETTHRFIGQFKDLQDIEFEIDEGFYRRLIALVSFCACGRCGVETDYKTGKLQYEPMPEGTPRLIKQLTNLAKGIALVQGKTHLDEQVYSLIVKLGRDLLPPLRIKVLEFLWSNGMFAGGNEGAMGGNISDATSLPDTTVDVILDELRQVGLLVRLLEKNKRGNANIYKWQLTTQAYQYAVESGIFGEPEFCAEKVTPEVPMLEEHFTEQRIYN